jgi:hypothetical protein
MFNNVICDIEIFVAWMRQALKWVAEYARGGAGGWCGGFVMEICVVPW